MKINMFLPRVIDQFKVRTWRHHLRMRYLDLNDLIRLNNVLAEIESDDGSRIYGRIEAYTCKSSYLPCR